MSSYLRMWCCRCQYLRLQKINQWGTSRVSTNFRIFCIAYYFEHPEFWYEKQNQLPNENRGRQKMLACFFHYLSQHRFVQNSQNQVSLAHQFSKITQTPKNKRKRISTKTTTLIMIDSKEWVLTWNNSPNLTKLESQVNKMHLILVWHMFPLFKFKSKISRQVL